MRYPLFFVACIGMALASFCGLALVAHADKPTGYSQGHASPVVLQS